MNCLHKIWNATIFTQLIKSHNFYSKKFILKWKPKNCRVTCELWISVLFAIYFCVLFNVFLFININSFHMKLSLILRAMRSTLKLLYAVCIDFSTLIWVLSFIWIIFCRFSFCLTHAIGVCSLFFPIVLQFQSM